MIKCLTNDNCLTSRIMSDNIENALTKLITEIIN